jgi:hypothetical protein
MFEAGASGTTQTTAAAGAVSGMQLALRGSLQFLETDVGFAKEKSVLLQGRAVGAQ